MKNVFKVLVIVTLCVSLVIPAYAGGQRGISIRAKEPSAVAAGLGSYHAVLIGINDYQVMPHLKTPVKDVEKLGQVLKDQYGFEDVVLITDKTEKKPTASNIVRLLREKAQKLTDKDNLLVYYAGHGNVDDLTKEGYWIPIDGKSDDPSSWIAHSQIRALLETEKIKIKNFLLVADSCYSGTMMRRSLTNDVMVDDDEDALNQKLQERASRKSREVITSGGNEPVEDGVRGSEHSLFAHYMIKSLEENQRKYVDVATLFNQQIQPQVDQKGSQRPERSRVRSAIDDDGLFVLAKLNVAERPKKPNLKEEMEKLKQENEAVKRQLEEERKKAEQKNAELKKLAAENEAQEKETETIRRKLEEEKKKSTAEKARLAAERKSLLSDKNSLEELARKNMAEEERLQALQKNSNNVATASLTEIEQQKQRMLAERSKIEAERKKVRERERLQEETEARLKKEEEKRKLVEEEQQQRMAQIRKETEKLEAQRRKADEERARIENELTKQKLAMEQERLKLKEERELYSQKLEELKPVASDAKGRFLLYGDVVIDTRTRLMWLKNANYPYRGMELDEAMQYVDNLKYGGYADWHLPTKEEWKVLVDKQGGMDGSYPDGHPFSNIVKHDNYWSSSINPLGPMYSYSINLGNGSVSLKNKNKVGYVWPVRYASSEDISKAKAQINQAKR